MMEQINAQSAIRNYLRDTELRVGKADENGKCRFAVLMNKECHFRETD